MSASANLISEPIVGKLESLEVKALSELQEGKYDEAISSYTQLIELDSTNFDYYDSRSLAYFSKRMFVYSLRDARKCIQLLPTSSRGYFREGIAFENLLQYKSCLESYRKGLALNSDDIDITCQIKGMEKLYSSLGLDIEGENTDTDVKYSGLQKWLKDNGAKFPKLHLKKYDDNNRSVHAYADVHTDEVLLYVPLKLIMTSEVARSSPIGLRITNSNIELRSKHTYLAAFILEEKKKGKDSFWYPYLCTLPATFPTIPLSFTNEELSELDGSFTVHKIADRLESVYSEYYTLCQVLPEFAQHSYEDFLWARLAVITRIFGLQVQTLKTDGMVPFGDMLNHRLPRQTRWYFDSNINGFVITSLGQIERGGEVYDSYGRKCNNRFFINYGFVVPDNADNEAVIKFSLDEYYREGEREGERVRERAKLYSTEGKSDLDTEPQEGVIIEQKENNAVKENPEVDSNGSNMNGLGEYAFKQNVLLTGGENSPTRYYQVPTDCKEIKTKQMFSFIRFITSSISELTTNTKSSKTTTDQPSATNSLSTIDVNSVEPKSLEGERLCLEYLRQCCVDRLYEYKTSIGLDERLLDQGCTACSVSTHSTHSPPSKTDDLPYIPLSLPGDSICCCDGSGVLSCNMRNIVTMRLGEKKVLEYYIDLVNTVFSLIGGDIKPNTTLGTKSRSRNVDVDGYIHNSNEHCESSKVDIRFSQPSSDSERLTNVTTYLNNNPHSPFEHYINKVILGLLKKKSGLFHY